MEQDPVLVERRGHVSLITLNRPEARNAVNAAMVTLVAEAVEQADHDPDIRAIVLTGAGGKAFCAGADLKAIARGEDAIPKHLSQWSFAGFVRHFTSKPTIAAVNGFALGGGTELVLACDLAVAARSATFGLPEVRRGIIAAAGGAFRLSSQIPQKAAMRMLLTGRPIDAHTALTHGLVNEVVEDDQLLDAALTLADEVCANAPLAVQATKRIAYGAGAGTWAGEEDYWRLTAAESAALRGSDDAREGPRAFAEKREPVWTGR